MSESQLNGPAEPEFTLQRLYVKDISLESPQVPLIFQKQWQLNPDDIQMQLQINHVGLGEEMYEVMLHVTVTIVFQEKTCFLAEVQQAGLFSLLNFTGEQLEPILNVTCPSILFPYAREVVSDLMVRATFPSVYLTPVNFEALYQDRKRQTSTTSQTAAVIV